MWLASEVCVRRGRMNTVLWDWTLNLGNLMLSPDGLGKIELNCLRITYWWWWKGNSHTLELDARLSGVHSRNLWVLPDIPSFLFRSQVLWILHKIKNKSIYFSLPPLLPSQLRFHHLSPGPGFHCPSFICSVLSLDNRQRNLSSGFPYPCTKNPSKASQCTCNINQIVYPDLQGLHDLAPVSLNTSFYSTFHLSPLAPF